MKINVEVTDIDGTVKEEVFYAPVNATSETVKSRIQDFKRKVRNLRINAFCHDLSLRVVL